MVKCSVNSLSKKFYSREPALRLSHSIFDSGETAANISIPADHHKLYSG
jgi:hypothetical protein